MQLKKILFEHPSEFLPLRTQIFSIFEQNLSFLFNSLKLKIKKN